MLRFNRWIFLFALLSGTLACGLFKVFVPAPKPLWTYSNPNYSPYYAALNIHDNKLFTYQSGTSNELPIAWLVIDPSSGQQLLKPVPNADLVIFDGIIGNHAIFNGRVSDTPNEDGDVLYPIIAINLSTGLEDWRYTGSVFDSGVTRSDNYLFVPKSYSLTDVLDLNTGAVISTFKMEYDLAEIFDLNPGWIKYIYTDTSIYSLSPAGVFRQYDTKKTTLQKTTKLDMPRYIQNAFIEESILYVYASRVLDGDESLLAYNMRTGQKLWEVKGLRGSAYGVDFYKGVGYLDTANGPSALDLASGKIMWSVPSQLSSTFIGDASNGRLLVAKKGVITAYDVSNGKKIWSRNTSLANSLNVNAINGVAYVTSADNPPAFQYEYVPRQLDAIDIETGNLIWSYENSRVTLPVDAGDHIIVGYEGGIVALPIR